MFVSYLSQESGRAEYANTEPARALKMTAVVRYNRIAPGAPGASFGGI
jgi:hypothetical protein